MNERDKALGRLLLARNQVARETLHQAAATTEARRAAGQQVEVVAVLVEMGALQTDAARAVWAEVAHVPPVPGGPPSGTFQRVQPQLPAQPSFPPPTFGNRAATPQSGVQRPSFPTGQRPAPMLSGEGDFSPVSTLSTMGEAPPRLPPGHDPLRSSRTMAAVPPAGPANLPPPARPSATAYSNAPGNGMLLDPMPATPTFGPAPGYGGSPPAYGAPPGFGPPPAFGPHGANGSSGFPNGSNGFPGPNGSSGFAQPSFGGSSGFGGGYSSAPVPVPVAQDLAAPFDAGGVTLGLPPGAAAAYAAPQAPFPAPGFASYPAPAPVGGPVGPAAAPAVLGPEIPLGGDAPASPSPDAKGTKKRGTSARLGPQARKTKLGATPARPGSNTTLILGGAACVAVLIVLGVVFALRGSKGGTSGGAAVDSSASPEPGRTTKPGRRDPEGEPEPERNTEARPRPRPQSEQGQRSLGLQSTPIQAEKDDASMRWADEVLVAATHLQDEEKYEEGIAELDKFPENMRTGEGFQRVQRLRAQLQLYAGFKRRLDDAIKEGPTSMNLKKLVARVEGSHLEDEVKELPCVARFQEEARKVLGDAVYNEIAVKSFDLDDLEEKE